MKAAEQKRAFHAGVMYGRKLTLQRIRRMLANLPDEPENGSFEMGRVNGLVDLQQWMVEERYRIAGGRHWRAELKRWGF